MTDGDALAETRRYREQDLYPECVVNAPPSFSGRKARNLCWPDGAPNQRITKRGDEMNVYKCVKCGTKQVSSVLLGSCKLCKLEDYTIAPMVCIGEHVEPEKLAWWEILRNRITGKDVDLLKEQHAAEIDAQRAKHNLAHDQEAAFYRNKFNHSEASTKNTALKAAELESDIRQLKMCLAQSHSKIDYLNGLILDRTNVYIKDTTAYRRQIASLRGQITKMKNKAKQLSERKDG